jgi:hypothetical protein
LADHDILGRGVHQRWGTPYVVPPDTGDGWVSIAPARAADLPDTIGVVAPQPSLLQFVPATSSGALPDGSAVLVNTWVLTVLPDAVAG